MCGPRCRVVSGVGCGSFLLFVGILSLTFAPSVIDRIVLFADHLGTVEVNGTRVPNEMTKQWKDPAYNMKLEISIFNVTNPAEVLNGAMPILTELGPYTFVEKQGKSFNFSHNDTHIIYRNRHLYFYNQSLSCFNCSLNQKVVVPNIIYQKLVDFAKSDLEKFAVDSVLRVYKNESVFVEVTVGQLLFDGYQDEIIGAICNRSILKPLCDKAKIPNKIGFFYGQNNTDDGEYEINTGKGEPWNIGKIFKWNGMTAMPNVTWDSPEARMINGSDGQLFPPLIQPGDNFTLFAAAAGRSIYLENLGISSYGKVPTLRFNIPSWVFDGTLVKNRIFCNKDTPKYFNASIQFPGCLPKGFIDVGRTQPGSPRVYLSQAHFFDVEPLVAAMIAGIKKGNAKNDTTIIDIEPTTGVVMKARRAMQVNVGMLKGKLELSSKTRDMIMPVLWMNETILCDEKTYLMLAGLSLLKHTFFILGVGLIVAGGVMWVSLAAILLVYTMRKGDQDEDRQPIMSAENPDVSELDYSQPNDSQ